MDEARFRTLGELVELLVDKRGLICDEPMLGGLFTFGRLFQRDQG